METRLEVYYTANFPIRFSLSFLDRQDFLQPRFQGFLSFRYFILIKTIKNREKTKRQKAVRTRLDFLQFWMMMRGSKSVFCGINFCGLGNFAEFIFTTTKSLGCVRNCFNNKINSVWLYNGKVFFKMSSGDEKGEKVKNELFLRSKFPDFFRQ